jgi:repressor LexA
MDLKKFIGQRIKVMREKRSMSQGDLAELLDSTTQSVSRYENGERYTNPAILLMLSRIFKVSIDDFFPK